SIVIDCEGAYEACLKARRLSLRSVFQAKLGWLAGNIYARVGTDDWVPTVMNVSDFKRHIEHILSTQCQWVDDKKYAAASKEIKRQGIDITQQSEEDLRR